MEALRLGGAAADEEHREDPLAHSSVLQRVEIEAGFSASPANRTNGLLHPGETQAGALLCHRPTPRIVQRCAVAMS